MNYRKLTVEESLVNTSADDCKSTLDNYERRYLHAARKRALKRLDARARGRET